ncbi:transposase [Nonomuraea fuscirosea]
MCWPRSAPATRPKSKPPTGRSSTLPTSARTSSLASSSWTGRIDAFADTWAGRYPAAVKCLLADRQSLTTYLRFPLEHHKRVRHSNFIERTFGETRRRVKVIGRFPSETSCVSLVWAVLDRASRGWRGFTQTSTGLRILHDLRRALLDPPAQLHPTGDPALAPVTEAA